MSTSEKDETQARVLAMTKERDEFAKLALERGKALEVISRLLVGVGNNVDHLQGYLKDGQLNYSNTGGCCFVSPFFSKIGGRVGCPPPPQPPFESPFCVHNNIACTGKQGNSCVSNNMSSFATTFTTHLLKK